MTGLLPYNILAEFNPLQSVVAAPIFAFSIGPWTIVVSNHMFMVTLTTVLLLIIIPVAVRRNGMVPSGIRNVVESVCVFFREEVVRPILGSHTDTYIGFIWSVFFFILSLNLLGMVPLEKIVTLLTGKENHFGGGATANIWVTGGMAFVVFIMTHIAGVREKGFIHYLASLAPPVPFWIMPFIYFLEIISAFVRPFALAIRLFANMIAGHILLAVFVGLILMFKSYGIAFASIISTAALSFMELLVSFIQAYIFAFLTTLYIGFSVESEH